METYFGKIGLRLYKVYGYLELGFPHLHLTGYWGFHHGRDAWAWWAIVLHTYYTPPGEDSCLLSPCFYFHSTSNKNRTSTFLQFQNAVQRVYLRLSIVKIFDNTGLPRLEFGGATLHSLQFTCRVLRTVLHCTALHWMQNAEHICDSSDGVALASRGLSSGKELTVQHFPHILWTGRPKITPLYYRDLRPYSIGSPAC